MTVILASEPAVGVSVAVVKTVLLRPIVASAPVVSLSSRYHVPSLAPLVMFHVTQFSPWSKLSTMYHSPENCRRRFRHRNVTVGHDIIVSCK